MVSQDYGTSSAFLESYPYSFLWHKNNIIILLHRYTDIAENNYSICSKSGVLSTHGHTHSGTQDTSRANHMETAVTRGVAPTDESITATTTDEGTTSTMTDETVIIAE